MNGVPELLYFGCLHKAGHHLHSKVRYIQYHETPWGYNLDSALLPQSGPQPEGLIHFHKRDGWTAVAFWDRSVDVRPGSWSGFIVDRDWTEMELLTAARQAWPEVFARKGFPLNRPDPRVIEVE